LDQKTLTAYDLDAHSFAEEWESQPTPTDMHDVVKRFFKSGPTADIGCGSGRDAAWLRHAGLPVIGYDASDGLLAEARRLHPNVRFHRAHLPELHGITNASLTNVLCETVIMHLRPALITPSVRKLMAILKPAGTLYLSWRVTEGTDTRDGHGRLYTAFDPSLVFDGLGDADILLDEQTTSASSGRVIRRIVARRKPAAS
jgi:SAM-dependent methyltransferase